MDIFQERQQKYGHARARHEMGRKGRNYPDLVTPNSVKQNFLLKIEDATEQRRIHKHMRRITYSRSNLDQHRF
jgi:TfoX/Sxy family transcriptional regulator of competence genes